MMAVAVQQQPGLGASRPAAQQQRLERPCSIPSRCTVQRMARRAQRQGARRAAPQAAAAASAATPAVRPEAEVPGMSEFLDRLKWDSNGLVVAIAQHADTGEVLMQAFADRAAVCETLQTGCVTCRQLARRPAAAPVIQCCLPSAKLLQLHVLRGCVPTTGLVLLPPQAGHVLQPLAQGAVVQGRDVGQFHQGLCRSSWLDGRESECLRQHVAGGGHGRAESSAATAV